MYKAAMQVNMACSYHSLVELFIGASAFECSFSVSVRLRGKTNLHEVMDHCLHDDSLCYNFSSLIL
jgi:hypothetical protein